MQFRLQRARNPRPTYVVVHCHIYKNAGSSIEHLLWKSFGDDFFILETAPGHARLEPRWVQDFLSARPRARAISSHGIHPPVDLPGALPFTLLRHPADRARSLYQYGRATPAAADHEIARAVNFRDYVEWSIVTRGAGAALRDQQVRHLSDAAYRTEDPDRWPCTQNDLEQAKALLRDRFAFGLVRRFAESCRLINATYRPLVPGLFLRNYAENVSTDPLADEAAVLAKVRDELGEATYARLCDATSLDIELYRFACAEFGRRMARLDSVPGRTQAQLRLLAGRVRQRIAHPEYYGSAARAMLHTSGPVQVTLPQAAAPARQAA